MKKLLGILVLGLLLSSNAYANDINDFKMEGMSIGDSLLDYFSENEIEDIKKNTDVFIYDDKTFLNLLNFNVFYWQIFQIFFIYLCISRFNMLSKKFCIKQRFF